MSAGAYLDVQIQRIWSEFKSQRRSIELMQRYDRKRITQLERRLKLHESRTKPQRPRLPRLPRSTS